MDTVIVVALLTFFAAFVWLALRCVPDAREVFWVEPGRPARRRAAPLDRLDHWDVLEDARGGHAQRSPAVVRRLPGAAGIAPGRVPRGGRSAGIGRPAASAR